MEEVIISVMGKKFLSRDEILFAGRLTKETARAFWEIAEDRGWSLDRVIQEIISIGRRAYQKEDHIGASLLI